MYDPKIQYTRERKIYYLLKDFGIYEENIFLDSRLKETRENLMLKEYFADISIFFSNNHLFV